MATKKGAPKKAAAKGVKAAKPAAKAPAKKPAAHKKETKPATKSAPAKRTAAPVAKTAAAKPAVKAAKPAAKPVAAKKAAEKAPAKAVAAKKAPAKAAAAPAKKAAPAKPAPAKQVEPVKKPAVAAPSQQEVKPAIKPLEKTAAKPAPKPEPAKPAKVVIPKTSITTSVKYQPDFTKSVLDTTPATQQEQSGPTMRYSDAELMEFRELINKKLDTAKKELAYLQGLITRRDESGDLDEGRYMTMEDGSMSMEREQLSQMASRQIQFIDHLEKALMRIENKTYGVCRVTGKLIDKARLRAVPHATLSIEAKQMMNK